MRVLMTAFARRQIRETSRYIYREFGRNSRDKFLLKVDEAKRLLATNPYIGPVEPLLSNFPTTYRSMVVARLNKMVYRIMDDHIEIADFWDCRREPGALAAEIK